MNTHGSQIAARVALAYAFGAAMWVLVSDFLVERFVASASAQTLKGLLFVGVTTGLLFLLLRRYWEAQFALRARHGKALDVLTRVLEASPGFAFRRATRDDWPVLLTLGPTTPLTGHDPEALRARSGYLPLVHPDDRPGLIEAVAQATRRGGTYAIRYRLCSAAGDERWVLEHGCVGHDGEDLHEGFCLDTTERHQLESQLARTQQMEVVGRLAAGTAHDFNNLLLVVLGHSELLEVLLEQLPPDLAAETRPSLDAIREATDRAGKLTKRLFALGRQDPANLQPVSLNLVVQDLSSLLTKLVGPAHSVAFSLTDDPTTVCVDALHIEQVLLNLVSNARDASAPETSITLSTERRGDRVVLSVTDRGRGMDPETRARAFEPFFTTKDDARGTGLGLPTVHTLVVANGGEVELHSQPGHGTRVEVTFPASSERPSSSSTGALARSLPAGSAALVLEHDPEVSDLLLVVLRHSGLHPLLAEDADRALELWEAHREDVRLVLCDRHPRGTSGRAFVARLRRERPELAAVFLSSSLQPGEDVQDPVLPKPPSPSELASTIEGLLRPEGG